MNILFITNMYPTDDYIYFGIHVKEQIDSIISNFHPNHKITFINGRKSKWNYLKSIVSINRQIARSKYDIVHIHFGLSGMFLLINPFFSLKTVVTLHSADIDPIKAGWLTQLITKFVVRRVDKVIILNDRMEDILKLHRDKLIRIPCGIDLDMFSTARNNLNNEVFTIGFPGNKRRPEKNYTLFKEIIDILNQKYNVKVVEFHNLTRVEVSQKLSELDCLLMTSLSEGSPQIIKEAMANNVPIVSSNVGDVNYLLENVANSYIVNSFEAEEFIEPIVSIIKLLAKERLTNGREKLNLLGLDLDSVASRIYKVYSETL